MDSMTRKAPLALLAAALLVVGVLTLVLTAELTFYQDTWDYLINRRAITADSLLMPHSEHIVVIPVAIEQLFLRLFGMTTALPEYVLLTAMLLVAAFLLFVYMRRRVGSWLALFGAVLLLCLGPAWEVLLWPFEICFVGSVIFGIAMLLALDRNDRRGDIAACAFLVVAFGFSELGIPFAAAGAVYLFQGRRERGLGRAYLVAVPAALYAAWWLGWGHDAESHLSLHNVLASPEWVANGVAMAVGSLVGLDTNTLNGPTDPVWGRAILVVLVAVLIHRQLRKPGFPSGFWPVAAAATANWFLGAFNQAPGRDPTASRYQYAGAIFVLLLSANLLQGVRLSKRGVLIGAALTLIAIGPGLVVLKEAKGKLQEQTVFTRADLGALEIAKRTVDPNFGLTPEVAGTPSLVNVTAGQYLTAVDEYGSPAYSPAELLRAPEQGRRQADIVLSQALPISTVTRLGAYSSDGGGENCVSVPAGGTSGTSGIPVSGGLTRIEVSPGPPASFSLRRFAVGEYPVPTKGAPGGSVTVLRIPPDSVSRPWHLDVDARQPARVCR